MPDKWDKYVQQPDKWAQYATEDAPEAPEAPDFTLNPKGEGLYRVGSYDFHEGRVSKPEMQVPFSRIPDALASGYKLHPDERARYQKDFAHQGKGPTAWEQTKGWLDRATAPMPDMPLEFTTNRTVGSAIRSTPAALSNVGKMPFNVVNRTVRGLAGLPQQVGQQAAGIYHGDPAALESFDPATMAESEWKSYQSDLENLGPAAALSNVGGDAATAYLTGKATELPAKSLRGLQNLGAERYGPRPVKVAGVNIPMTVGEANPLSRAGRLETRLKQSGIEAERFEKLEHAQQVLVKRAIRNVAAQAAETEAHGLPTDPQAAMKDAADITFAKARPMYAAMDSALRTTPASFGEVSPIVKTAIDRARKLGVVIEPEAEQAITMDGKRITQSENPELWRRLVDQGIINEQGQGTPLSAFVKVRSQLLKIQRASADPAIRYAAGEEVRNMNKGIEAALQNTPHFDNWVEANRLWSKGYALREVAAAIRKSTRGTPSSVQAPELSPVAPKLQASGLVSRLNQLATTKTLENAFSAEEEQNLRAAADVLDRIQRTKVGKGPGEHMSISRGLSHAMRGAAAPAIGAGVGFLVGGIHGMEAGAGLGLAVKYFGEHALARIMTRTDGVTALKMLETAKTPAEMQSAMKALAVAVAASAGQTKSLKQLRQEADKHKPALAAPSPGN